MVRYSTNSHAAIDPLLQTFSAHIVRYPFHRVLSIDSLIVALDVILYTVRTSEYLTHSSDKENLEQQLSKVIKRYRIVQFYEKICTVFEKVLRIYYTLDTPPESSMV
jgi:hypothetical protein